MNIGWLYPRFNFSGQKMTGGILNKIIFNFQQKDLYDLTWRRLAVYLKLVLVGSYSFTYNYFFSHKAFLNHFRADFGEIFILPFPVSLCLYPSEISGYASARRLYSNHHTQTITRPASRPITITSSLQSPHPLGEGEGTCGIWGSTGTCASPI